MYLVFTRMPGESYRRRFGSLLCLCDVFRELINYIVLILQECSGPHFESDIVNSSIKSKTTIFSTRQSRSYYQVHFLDLFLLFYLSGYLVFSGKLIFSHKTHTWVYDPTHTHTLIFQIAYKISLQAIPTDSLCVCVCACMCKIVGFFFTVLILCSSLCNGLCALIWRNDTYIIDITTNYVVLNLNWQPRLMWMFHVFINIVKMV